MIQEVKLPEVSENIESGDVVKVLVQVGDMIELEQPVIELETDKAMFEVPSTAKGKVTEVNVKEGESINIGSVILKVETEGGEEEAEKDKKEVEEKTEEKKEDIKEEGKEKKEEKEEEKEEEKDQTKEDKSEEAEKGKQEDKEENKKEDKGESKPRDKTETKEEDKKEPEEERKPQPQSELEDKVSADVAPASPSVRRLARELGVEINRVTGSGPSGRISEDDVKSYVKQVVSRKADAPAGGGIAYRQLPDFSKWGEVKKEPMSKVRRLTAESMTYAWTTIPMVTQFDKTDITSFEEFRKRYNKSPEAEKAPLTVTSVLVKIVTAALKKFPQFNSSIDMENEEVIYKSFYNIGIAVDTDRGLLVPVIKDADNKSIHDISTELTELAERTREKKIKPDEMEGGTFTISNLGGIGGTNFTPIVYAPQVAILGVSRASKEAVYKENGFVPALMLPLTLTYDHRIIDGADAARFLRWICQALENPFMIL